MAFNSFVILLVKFGLWGAQQPFSYFHLTLFRMNYFWVLSIPLLGIFTVMLFSIVLFNNSKVLRWLGRNSLVIMCVHFPLCQYLNLQIAQLKHFDIIQYKILYGTIEYFLVFTFSILMALFCNKYIPFLTGRNLSRHREIYKHKS